MMMRISLIALAISAALASGCQTVETTQQGAVGVDRKQHMLVSEQEVEASAQKEYAQMMADAQKKGGLDKDAADVGRAGVALAASADYNPQAAVSRGHKMAKLNSSGARPKSRSTHPSDED